MSLSPDAVGLLRTVLAMGALTAVMATWMSLVRMPAMRTAGLRLQDAAHVSTLRERLPSRAVRVADNYNHLLEAPTVFYAVVLVIVVAGLADRVYVACAWAFVATRVAHSLVQATFNLVKVRALLYGLSWIALAVLVVRPLFQI